MARWIATVNAKKDFDIEQAIANLETIYWGKYNFSFEINDILFLYLTVPEQRVKFKFKVVSIISTEDYPQEQLKYWRSQRYLKYQKGYIGLILISSVDSQELTLNKFREEGFIGIRENIQGRRNDKLEGKSPSAHQNSIEWFDYIDSFFEASSQYDYPEEAYINHELFPEGAKVQIKVNGYERDPKARAECIKLHGCKCEICEMSFNERYGSFAEGFIHVHHKKPLHQVKDEYLVDPKDDLIPVCPNCHAMLHRKIEGKDVTIDQLKLLYQSRNS